MPHCWKSHVVAQICLLKNSRLGYDLHKSVGGFAISQGFLFSRNLASAKFRENKPLAKVSEFTGPHNIVGIQHKIQVDMGVQRRF